MGLWDSITGMFGSDDPEVEAEKQRLANLSEEQLAAEEQNAQTWSNASMPDYAQADYTGSGLPQAQQYADKAQQQVLDAQTAMYNTQQKATQAALQQQINTQKAALQQILSNPNMTDAQRQSALEQAKQSPYYEQALQSDPQLAQSAQQFDQGTSSNWWSDLGNTVSKYAPVVAPLAGAVASRVLTADEREAEEKAQNESVDVLKNTPITDLSQTKLQFNQLNPYQEQSENLGLSPDAQKYRKAQESVLSDFARQGRTGMSMADQLQARQIEEENRSAARQASETALQQEQMRGGNASGASLLASLTGGQAGAQREALEKMKMFADAGNRRQNAVAQQGQLGGQLEQAQSAIDKANWANRADVQQRNVSGLNSAQKYNTDLANTELKDQLTRKQQYETARANQAKGISSAQQDMANFKNQQAASKAGFIGDIATGAGGLIGTAAGGNTVKQVGPTYTAQQAPAAQQRTQASAAKPVAQPAAAPQNQGTLVEKAQQGVEDYATNAAKKLFGGLFG